MPIRGNAPVVHLAASKPSLEDRAKGLLEGRVIQEVSLRAGQLKLSLDSGQILEVSVGEDLKSA